MENLMEAPSPFDRVMLSRHAERPYFLDYIKLLCTDFTEIHGDRRYADDPALVCGLARYHDEPVAVIGHQKGRDLKSRQTRNFGMAKPEGYRKALRVMQMADKFKRPILTFVDTPGAYPGIQSEERNIAEAVAYNLREISLMTVPIVTTVIGEGGSGGALGIAIADRVLMQENCYYTVIAPESCSAILWRDREHMQEAANALRLTAPHLKELGVIDEIVPEPEGGAHTNVEEAARLLDQAIQKALTEIRPWSAEERMQKRYEKFRALGSVQGEEA